MAGFKNEQLWRIRITVNTFCYRDITGIRKISSPFFASSNYYHNLAGSRSSRPATLPFRNAEIRIWIALEFLCTGSDTPVRSKSYGIGNYYRRPLNPVLASYGMYWLYLYCKPWVLRKVFRYHIAPVLRYQEYMGIVVTSQYLSRVGNMPVFQFRLSGTGNNQNTVLYNTVLKEYQEILYCRTVASKLRNENLLQQNFRCSHHSWPRMHSGI